ncbi:histone-lysine N-methyltransferase SETMAR [Trichonephila clavipes]|nr:histone-lysine N-methyltransferase SETMAR [Trichonephila clavipes]
MHGPLLLEFKEPEISLNVQRCTQILDKLHKAIKNKPSILSSGDIILHDHARPHVAKACVETLECKKWKVLGHPAYNPGLSPCDNHIFGPLKKSLMGQRFHSDNYVKAAILNWFHDRTSLTKFVTFLGNWSHG